MVVSFIPVPGKYAIDVAVIDKNTVAITSGNEKTVRIVDFPSSSIKRSFRTYGDCHGITYNDHHLYCCVLKKGIIKISVNTGDSSLFYRTALPVCSYITNHNNKLFFTEYISHTVTCCDMEGKEV